MTDNDLRLKAQAVVEEWDGEEIALLDAKIRELRDALDATPTPTTNLIPIPQRDRENFWVRTGDITGLSPGAEGVTIAIYRGEIIYIYATVSEVEAALGLVVEES